MLRTVTTLRDPLIRPLGRKASDALEQVFGLHTVGDLLRHYPRRYYTRGELSGLAALREGDHVTVLARVETARLVPMQRWRNHPQKGGLRDRAEVTVTDGTARLTLTFFAKAPYHVRVLQPGKLGLFAGTVSTFRGHRQLVHPEYELLPESLADDRVTEELAAEYATEMIPVYPASAKLSSWQISKAVQVVLDTLDAAEDPLPEEVRRPPVPDGIAAEFDKRLPFTLTEGQRFVGEVIARDLSCAYPMNRLLQGEVGSGKTVVAVRAMLQVVDAGGQAALLAPTEVLAQQHYRSITQLLGPLASAGLLGGAEHATRVALLTGSTGKAARRSALSDVFTGDAGILIGTHALLEDRVQFADLGLVVIDEQHRFGVEQRDALRDKAAGARPHVLVMTATPIPRTVAMTVFGDLEVSTLSELPAGRSPITTHVVPVLERPRFLERAWARVREEVEAGRQAYVVCPRIGGEAPDEAEDEEAGDEGDVADLIVGADEGAGSVADFAARRPPLAVLDMAPALADGPLSGLRVGILHGRLSPDEKDRVMTAFAAGEVDVLVATTVIEVGVDVPNATVMVVMDAERFGVSQLHQLRGRVGRGGAAGLCLLVTEAPEASQSRERLDAIAATADGFRLSRLDLEQRREGDVLGAAQAGRQSSLKMLRLLADEELIAFARQEASAVVEADPQLAAHPALRDAIDDLLGPQRAEFLDKA